MNLSIKNISHHNTFMLETGAQPGLC